MTQQQLANVTGIERSSISKYEKSIISPAAFKLNKIAEALEVDINVLLSDDEPKKVYSAADLFSGVGFNPDSSLPVIKEEKDSDLKTVIIEQNGKKHKFEVRSKASNEEIAEKFKLFLQFVEFTDGDDKK